MTYKIAGCCSLCDEPCFEVMARWDAGEKRAGEPKRFGPPMNGATKISFQLFDGSVGAFTFCGRCAKKVTTDHYTRLWNRNLAGYMREQDGDPSKFKNAFANGLLCELGRKPWKEAR